LTCVINQHLYSGYISKFITSLIYDVSLRCSPGTLNLPSFILLYLQILYCWDTIIHHYLYHHLMLWSITICIISCFGPSLPVSSHALVHHYLYHYLMLWSITICIISCFGPLLSVSSHALVHHYLYHLVLWSITTCIIGRVAQSASGL
jgi:hypothetical protein